MTEGGLLWIRARFRAVSAVAAPQLRLCFLQAFGHRRDGSEAGSARFQMHGGKHHKWDTGGSAKLMASFQRKESCDILCSVVSHSKEFFGDSFSALE